MGDFFRRNESEREDGHNGPEYEASTECSVEEDEGTESFPKYQDEEIFDAMSKTE